MVGGNLDLSHGVGFYSFALRSRANGQVEDPRAAFFSLRVCVH
ncbi:MAG TPA: hypothetical protein VMS89_00180 [Methanoregulaceae archaeon]|nr:hypothetical protein [Methanoregulaceae archaeon]